LRLPAAAAAFDKYPSASFELQLLLHSHHSSLSAPRNSDAEKCEMRLLLFLGKCFCLGKMRSVQVFQCIDTNKTSQKFHFLL
jgi:hypothetical protein